MKKLLLALTILLTFTLVGCRSDEEPKLTVGGWARHYALQRFEEDNNFTFFASKVEELDITPQVLIYDYEDIEDYDYCLFRVIVASDEGTEYIYHIFIVYDEPFLLAHFFEERIIYYETELVVVLK